MRAAYWLLSVFWGISALTGCGGNTEKDMNPNPNLEFSKEGAPKRGGGIPKDTPKGAKGAPDKK